MSIIGHEAPRHAARRALWRAAAWVVGLFWAVQLAELVAVNLAEGRQTAFHLLAPRGAIIVAGVLLSVPVVEVVSRMAARPFYQRLTATLGTALAACALLLVVNFAAIGMNGEDGPEGLTLARLVYPGVAWSWFFLGLAGAILGLASSLEVREKERRLSEVREVAREARLAALRYQLNPHFLFNSLNSIAALIQGGETGPAERVTESLADFLRTTLELDPVSDIRLSQEMQLQVLYLGIEEIRFPDRLRPLFDIEPAVAAAAVPALILQPLVENAIKHAVARTTQEVTVTLSARSESGHVHIVVENDRAGATEALPGVAGLGLDNVRARLWGRFGDEAAIRTERKDDVFRVVVTLPFRSVA